MARTLSKKQRVFVNRKADGATGVAAVLNNYATEDYDTAAVIASENIRKPNIVAELKLLGFDSNNAKRVVGEILNNEFAEEKDRLSAADKVFKVNRDYADDKPEKPSVTINLTVKQSEAETLRQEYEEKLKAKLLQ